MRDFMRYLLPVGLLLGTLARGQGTPAPSNVQATHSPVTSDDDAEPALPASASKIEPNAAVITIKGLCSQTSRRSSASASKQICQTVITRAQFEKLTDAVLPNKKPSSKRQLANGYPHLLAMAREAEARGLEKTSRVEQRLAFARVQILSQELVRQIEADSAKVSAKDIEDYYRSHADTFKQATLERVFIPNRKQMAPLPKEKTTPEAVEAQRKEAEDAMTREAEELRARAVTSEDFAKLEKDAYQAAGSADVPPNASLGQLSAADLPPAHASVFELKAGEISQVFSDSTGHYIYKLDGKTVAPLEAVSDEIHKTLQNQHREQAIQAVQQPITTEMNKAYFGPAEEH